jgi:hypothetical protein
LLALNYLGRIAAYDIVIAVEIELVALAAIFFGLWFLADLLAELHYGGVKLNIPRLYHFPRVISRRDCPVTLRSSTVVAVVVQTLIV